MSIYSPKEENRAKFTAALLAVIIIGAITLWVFSSHDQGVTVPLSTSVGNAARTEVVHQAEGRNGDPGP